jgi:hypothetical protein
MSIADLIGVLGVSICLLAYSLNVLQRLTSDGWLYPLLNALSSCLILVSLAGSFNLAAVLMEGSWLAVSLFAVVTFLRRRLVAA